MRPSYVSVIATFMLLFLLASCANIATPTGGKKDTIPPKLVSISPADSLLNTKVSKITLRFDEFISLQDAGKEVQVSPVLPIPVTTVAYGKRVVLTIPDSLLQDSTTYRISFGKAIRDVHEGNPFPVYNYTFSTGGFFDSLIINGYVVNAATGKPAEGVVILLYDAKEDDSAIVRKKPLYVSAIGSGGTFVIPGLPAKTFRIYALKDANENLVYDGDEEQVAFIDSFVRPRDSMQLPIQLRLFKELPRLNDTAATTVKKNNTAFKRDRRGKDDKDNAELRYSLSVDTADKEKRTFDVTKPIRVSFSNDIDTYNKERIFLSYDSAGTDVETDFSLVRDTTQNVLLINTGWKDNTLYTIRLLKDFATDTSGVTTLPSKYIFRTKSDDDYGVINIHMPTKFYGKEYVLQVLTEKDTVYRKPVTDSTIILKKLNPDKYIISIIVDENGNGRWDTGDLFAKKQPEIVIPYNSDIQLKAGWENQIDFVEPVNETDPNETSPKKRDKKGLR